MKHYTYLLVLALFLCNCSKSDDSSEAAIGDLETLIIGEWKTESKTLNGDPVVLNCSNGLSHTITFSDTAIISFGVDYDDGNGCDALPFSGTYYIDGNLVLFTNPWNEDTDIMTVLSINDTTLKTIYTSPDDDVSINNYQKN